MKRRTRGSLTPTHVLDTSAVIAYLAQEPGGEQLKTIRRTAALPFIVITELYYVIWRKHEQTFADRVIQDVLSWRLPLLTADERLSLSAGYIKSRFQLGLADSYIAACALAYEATLVTKDADFHVLEPDLKCLFL